MKLSAISPRQIRAARMLLAWSQSDLAKYSQVSITVIARIETASVDARLSTILAILKAFEDNGIEFVDEGDGRIGVLCRPPAPLSDRRRRPVLRQ